MNKTTEMETSQNILIDTDISLRYNTSMHNVEKWPSILQKICEVRTAKFFKVCFAR